MSRRKTKKPLVSHRPFPWRCRDCGEKAVKLSCSDYQAEVRHDGKLHSFLIPKLEAPTCQSCGERVFTETVDEQINVALREHLQLLSPEQMREAFKRVQLTQKIVSQQLGIAAATLSRWLSKTQIQSRSMDTLLRVFFGFPRVREILANPSGRDQLGIADISDSDSQISHRSKTTRESKTRRATQGNDKQWNGERERCLPVKQAVSSAGSTWGKVG